MLAARAAVLGGHFPQMLPGAVQPNGEIVLGHPELGGDFRNFFPFQIDLLQQLAVLLGDRWYRGDACLSGDVVRGGKF